MSSLRGVFIRSLFAYFGILSLYRSVCEDVVSHEKHNLREDLKNLLRYANEHSPYFQGRWSDFLNTASGLSDDDFLAAYARLPVIRKQDYKDAGLSVVDSRYVGNHAPPTLKLDGTVLDVVGQVKRDDFLFALPTGGTTSLPLSVWMNKRHAFEMLFSFFKCWHEIGWKLGEKVLVFYPKDVYNIDEMAAKNYLRSVTGFHIQLFDRIDIGEVKDLVRQINTFKPHLLIVFPSTMNLVAHIIQQEKLVLTHQPKYINVSGETFFDCQRANIARAFPASIVQDSYGSVELGEIAHEIRPKQLNVFSHLAYIENYPTDDGRHELIITRLKQTNFPFIRYRMGDVGKVERVHDTWQLTNIEGKDSNYVETPSGQRLRPSYFNSLVNHLNRMTHDAVVEIKVLEEMRGHLIMYFVLRDDAMADLVSREAKRHVHAIAGESFSIDVRFVPAIAHDYRRKFRVIERAVDEVEYAGGIVGNAEKMQRLRIAT